MKAKKYQEKGNLHLKRVNQVGIYRMIDQIDTIMKDKSIAEDSIKKCTIKVLEETMKGAMRNKEDQYFPLLAVEKITEAREIHKSKQQRIESGSTQTMLKSQRAPQEIGGSKKDRKKSTIDTNEVCCS
jgi:hypothetical protein